MHGRSDPTDRDKTMSITPTLDRLKSLLEDALSSAKMENASFGFDIDRIKIENVHFGDDTTGRVGDVMHPTEYIKRRTKNYRNSWLVGPIEEAIRLVEQNAELLRQCQALRAELERSRVPAIIELARAGIRER